MLHIPAPYMRAADYFGSRISKPETLQMQKAEGATKWGRTKAQIHSTHICYAYYDANITLHSKPKQVGQAYKASADAKLQT